ncbi:MAG: autotransporter outer membrane beta-barrel domain-containing protein [Deltaproteobacteria bacterium]|nr:autotransporter outer membrane beta-barrel domain-containing protein [Deltaproteobacteria bacterium]
MGAVAETGNVTNNKLILNSANDIAGSAIGGGSLNSAGNAVVSLNQVSISQGNVGGIVQGAGLIGAGTLSGNIVNVTPASGSISIGRGIYGGLSGSGIVTGNQVNISGAGNVSIHGILVAGGTDGTDGTAGTSNLSSNTVLVEAGTGSVIVDDHVAGAYVSGSSAAVGHTVYNNTVTLNRGTYARFVAGAFGSDGNATTTQVKNATFQLNKVIINGDVSIANTTSGASTTIGTPLVSNNFLENSVTIDDSGLAGGFTASLVLHGVYGAQADGGTSEGNTVTVSTKGTVVIQGDLQGGNMERGSKVNGNTVDITTTGTGTVKINDSLAGGFNNQGATDSNVDGNKVRVSGKITAVGDVYGGRNRSGTADGNTVDIDGLDSADSTVHNIYGALVTNSNNDASASGNTVRLGNVKFDISATQIAAGMITGSATAAKAENNSFELFGKIDLGTNNVNLAVGGGTGVSDANKFKGNTLHFNHAAVTGRFGTVSGFDKLVFDVDSAAIDAANTQATALLQANSVSLSDGGTNYASVSLNVSDGGSLAGKTVYIVDSGTAIPAAYTGTVSMAVQGNVEYDLPLTVTSGNVLSTVVGAARPRAQTKALAELPLADVSFVNRGTDMIASQAIPTAIASVSGTLGVAAFAAVGYGWERTDTGSHIEVKGVSGDIGVAVGTDTSVGPFVAGAFLEFGDGSFDSYNEFSGLAGIPGVHGEGDLSYIGGGVFARLDLGQKDTSHPYFEASVRFGKTDADFKTRDLLASNGAEVKYDMDAKYWGFHAGGGYIIDFSSFDGSLDLSAKYFHMHRDGDDFLSFGQRVSLSSVTSSRVRVGGRLNAGFTRTISGYFGLYWEHEFNGDSRASVMGLALPEVSLGGSSGVGELGLIVSSPDSPIEVQMGVEGSAGKREAVSANLSLRVTF